jgi:hypothetical protein
LEKPWNDAEKRAGGKTALLWLLEIPGQFSGPPNFFQTFSKHFLGPLMINQWVKG